MISGSRVNGGIISSTHNESGDFIIQEFKVEVEKAGNYYLFAWINGALYPNSDKLEYSVSEARRDCAEKLKKLFPEIFLEPIPGIYFYLAG